MFFCKFSFVSILEFTLLEVEADTFVAFSRSGFVVFLVEPTLNTPNNFIRWLEPLMALVCRYSIKALDNHTCSHFFNTHFLTPVLPHSIYLELI